MVAWLLPLCSIHGVMVKKKCIFLVSYTGSLLGQIGRTTTDPNVAHRCQRIHETREVHAFTFPSPSALYSISVFCLSERSFRIPIQEEQVDSNSSLIKN